MLTTPGGNPAAWMSSPARIAVSGVASDGLMITALPHASAENMGYELEMISAAEVIHTRSNLAHKHHHWVGEMSINTSFVDVKLTRKITCIRISDWRIRQRVRLLTWDNGSYDTNRLVPGVGKLCLGGLYDNKTFKETGGQNVLHTSMVLPCILSHHPA